MPQEFVKLLDGEDRIIEYNQENLRLKSFNGRPSLIRSFPSEKIHASKKGKLYFQIPILTVGRVCVCLFPFF